MQKKRWILPESMESEMANQLMSAINVSAPIANILINRGITNFEQAKEYFRPSLEMLHDPFLMAGMEAAVDRLVNAIGTGEKILIYGDYDVDGTTSVAMFYHFLSSFYDHCEYYIPDRYKEGYGVSLAGVDYAEENNFSLIITLDCGIKSNDLVSLASKKGIDFIICDHHEPDNVLPPAVAVLDPKRTDCPYPYKELSGCGVGFKFIQAFLLSHPDIGFDPFSLLDLVCVSIAADIVPITGENRVLAYYGLQKLARDPHPGLAALMEVAGIQQNDVTISRVVFGLAPRINAAGRLEDAKYAVRLMLATDAEPAQNFARQLDGHNQQRKDIDRLITSQAHDMILENGWTEANTTVLFQPDWHKGVIGIVASRCIESYYRPTVILTETHDGILTGSARSVDGFDLYSALLKCSDLLEQFGGHKHAAGMTLRNENLEAFRSRFEAVVSSEITSDLLTPSIIIDTRISLDDINPKFFRIMQQMAPFGPGNAEPVFVAEDLIARDVRAFSARNNPDSNHLKLRIGQYGCTSTFEAIGFGMGEYADQLKKNPQGFGMAFAVAENRYMGRVSLQLYIKDIRWE
ncbi:single-stranded-DNA-specific exonuclease RecJ [Fulvivirga sedimenti]|uniref:Single-stranded-DNA-specific exonuclease RecJ n=1 Tax=Fulvivirga sedimenti TaxID=2879465 RepID=A0A9X1KZ67_9BACT|nr:single-stranded-DNA-specific exonuclease RecJ [Fulvivirga sedimenti]MCA6078603.1 single-stranded-DNA-specific exonuclease RecJ [Fulvivirga sedimenti]